MMPSLDPKALVVLLWRFAYQDVDIYAMSAYVLLYPSTNAEIPKSLLISSQPSR